MWLRTLRLLAALGLLLATLLPSTAFAQAKIAVIDLRRAVADTEDGLRVQAQLQELFDNRQAEFDAKEKAVAQAKADFEKMQRAGKSEGELRKKYAELEKMAIDLQSARVNYQREMSQKENQLMYPIIKQMLTLVRRLASQNSYDMVLNKEAVPYFRADLDITDRIIQMYNANQGGDDKGAKPKKPAPKKPAKGKR